MVENIKETPSFRANRPDPQVNSKRLNKHKAITIIFETGKILEVEENIKSFCEW